LPPDVTDAPNSIPGVCLSIRSSVRLCLDTFDESQRRRHGVTAAIAVDVVAVRVSPSVRPFVSNSFKRRTDRQSVRPSVS